MYAITPLPQAVWDVFTYGYLAVRYGLIRAVAGSRGRHNLAQLPGASTHLLLPGSKPARELACRCRREAGRMRAVRASATGCWITPSLAPTRAVRHNTCVWHRKCGNNQYVRSGLSPVRRPPARACCFIFRRVFPYLLLVGNAPRPSPEDSAEDIVVASRHV